MELYLVKPFLQNHTLQLKYIVTELHRNNATFESYTEKILVYEIDYSEIETLIDKAFEY